MQKLLLILTLALFSTTLNAQGLINNVFDDADAKSQKIWYKGQMRDKKPHGMGIWKTKDGLLHIGDFSSGKLNGYGITLAAQEGGIPNCAESVVYVGNWKNGQKAGAGTCYTENGDIIYSGKFENDKPAERYQQEEDLSLKYFSLVDYGNGDKYLGEIENGLFNGFGVYIWAGDDLWFGNFEDGARSGIGLYISGNGEWVIINCKGDDCEQIDSSAERAGRDSHKNAVRAQVRAENRELLVSAFNNFTAAIQTAKDIKAVWNTDTNSDSDESSDSASGDGSSKRSGVSSKQTGSYDCGSAWRTDSRTYSDYETQLIKMQTSPENYSNYTSDCTAIQSKMRQIRQKWESRGCTINKSPYE